MPPTFEQAVEEEVEHLSRVHPEPKDIPSCITILDEFLICYAMGPQLKNLYRHGEMKHCPEKWADFKFCLSLKGISAEQKRVQWIRRRAEWWASRRLGHSSEDVWDVRKTPLEPTPTTERAWPADVS